MRYIKHSGMLLKRTDESITRRFREMFAQTLKSNNYVFWPKLSGGAFGIEHAGSVYLTKTPSPFERAWRWRDHESRVGVAWGQWIWLNELNHGRPYGPRGSPSRPSIVPKARMIVAWIENRASLHRNALRNVLVFVLRPGYVVKRIRRLVEYAVSFWKNLHRSILYSWCKNPKPVRYASTASRTFRN